MTKKQLKSVERLAERIGGEVYRHYSGRGMFGRGCPGIVYKSADGVRFPPSLGRASTDSLGLDRIVYFPSITDNRNEPLAD